MGKIFTIKSNFKFYMWKPGVKLSFCVLPPATHTHTYTFEITCSVRLHDPRTLMQEVISKANERRRHSYYIT